MREKINQRNINLKSQSRLYAWRWWIFVLLIAGYISIELVEHPIIDGNISRDILLEIALFVLPLGIAFYMYGVLLETIAAKDQAVYLLDEKHHMILQVAKARDWDSLVSTIVQFPGRHVEVIHSLLQIYDDDSETFQVETEWTPGEGVLLRPISTDPPVLCDACRQEFDAGESGLRPCETLTRMLESPGGEGYRLPLFFGDKLIAMLCFALPVWTTLDEQTEAILNASSFEIASALEAARERRARLTSELSNVARGERLLIARDLHDTLGQNLGYLHLKLDRFTQEGFPLDVKQLKPELERMHLAADEAYEIVRGALAFMHQDDDVRMKLCELIDIHGKMIASRSGLDFTINNNGDSGTLPLQIVRQVYYAVKEALHNVERHARARQVNVTLNWGVKDLTIDIEDDGIGFDPQMMKKDRHFGLDMMRGRIEACKGRLSVEAAPEAGTHVTMWLPIKCDEKLDSEGQQV
jgi:signal transduction histidine kinase